MIPSDQATIDERGADRVGKHRIGRRGPVEGGYRESCQEDGRGDAQRTARRGGGVAGLGAPSSGRDVPDGHHMKYVADHEWGKRRHLGMTKLEEMDERKRENKG